MVRCFGPVNEAARPPCGRRRVQCVPTVVVTPVGPGTSLQASRSRPGSTPAESLAPVVGVVGGEVVVVVGALVGVSGALLLGAGRVVVAVADEGGDVGCALSEELVVLQAVRASRSDVPATARRTQTPTLCWKWVWLAR